MNGAFRQVIVGLSAAFLVLLVVLGSGSLAVREEMILTHRAPTATEIPSQTSAPTFSPSPKPTSSPEPTLSATPRPTLIRATATATLPTCKRPDSWIPYITLEGDSWSLLAAVFGSTPQEIMEYNCLKSDEIKPGVEIYLPPLSPILPATAVPSVSACYAPWDWWKHEVQAGETLFGLSLFSGSTVEELRINNCIAVGVDVHVGEIIYLPSLRVTPTSSATLTGTPIPSLTPSPIPTSTATLPPGVTPLSPPASTPTVEPNFTPRPPSYWTPTVTSVLPPLWETPQPAAPAPAASPTAAITP